MRYLYSENKGTNQLSSNRATDLGLFFCTCKKKVFFSLRGSFYCATFSGEFDDLVSALRTGDIFGDDIAKMKRNRRRVGANISTSRERVNEEVRL